MDPEGEMLTFPPVREAMTGPRHSVPSALRMTSSPVPSPFHLKFILIGVRCFSSRSPESAESSLPGVITEFRSASAFIGRGIGFTGLVP